MKTFNEKLDDLLDEYSVIDGRLFHHEDKKDFKQFIIDLVCGAVEEAKPNRITNYSDIKPPFDGQTDFSYLKGRAVGHNNGIDEYQDNLINIVRGK